MAITITEILGTDPIGGSRPIINTNFKNIKTAIDSLQETIATGTQSIELKNGVNSTIKLTGNTGTVECSTVVVSGSSSINAAGSISGVGLTISGATSLTGTLVVGNNTEVQGNTWLQGTLRKSGGLSNIYIPSDIISVTDKFLVNVNYSSIVGSGIVSLVSIPGGVSGQEIMVRCLSISNGSNTDGINGTNISNAPNGIRFTSNHGTAKLYYDGTNWIVIGLYGATII